MERIKPEVLGERAFEVCKSLDPGVITNPRLLQRVAGRLVEELTELCIECGMSINDIFGHVADAVYNEAKKVGKYPTQMGPPPYCERCITKELADVKMLSGLIMYLCGISSERVNEEALQKLTKMKEWAENGEAHMVDGLFYRKVQKS